MLTVGHRPGPIVEKTLIGPGRCLFTVLTGTPTRTNPKSELVRIYSDQLGPPSWRSPTRKTNSSCFQMWSVRVQSHNKTSFDRPSQNKTIQTQHETRAHCHGEHHWKPHRSNHLSFTLQWQTGGFWWQPLLAVPHRKSQRFERDIFTQQSTIHDAWRSFRSLSSLTACFWIYQFISRSNRKRWS